MTGSELWDKLFEKAKADAWHRKCLLEVRRTEAAFLRIREALCETEKDELDEYIAACEALEDSFVFLAYELGMDGEY